MASLITTKELPIIIPDDLPASVDWRDKIKLQVQNQKESMACWALTTATVVDAVRQIKNPEETFNPLSSQMLLDCVKKKLPKSQKEMKKGYTLTVLKAFEWLKDNELYGEEDYGHFRGKRGPCRCQEILEDLKGYEREKFMRQVCEHPAAAVIDASYDFIHVGKGIYEGPTVFPKEESRHAVAVVGYGTDGDEPTAKNYWLVMSTWGTNWGDGGFAKVSRDHKLLDGNYLLRRISYPLL